MSALHTYPLTVYVQITPANSSASTPSNAPQPFPAHSTNKDRIEQVPVTIRTTCADVVRVVGEGVLGAEVDVSGYALYETEFVREDDEEQFADGRGATGGGGSEDAKKATKTSQQTPQARRGGRRKGQDVVHRKFIRVLEPDEFPLLIQYNWRYQRNAQNFNFVIKLKEIEQLTTFNILRKEQCKALPLDKLYRRLTMLDREEERTKEEIRRRYYAQRKVVLEKLASLGVNVEIGVSGKT